MEKIENIEVRPLTNGYSLKFDGMKQDGGYMYFTKENLLYGFMMHIGLEMANALTVADMKEFIITANRWNDNKKNVEEIERLTAALATAEERLGARTRETLSLRKRIETMYDLILDASKTKDKDEKDSKVACIVKRYGKIKRLTAKEKKLADEYEKEEEKKRLEDGEE